MKGRRKGERKKGRKEGKNREDEEDEKEEKGNWNTATHCLKTKTLKKRKF